MAEQKTYQGHTYQRSAPGQPWSLVGPVQTGVTQLGGADPKLSGQVAGINLGNTKTKVDTGRVEALLPYDLARAKADAEGAVADTKLKQWQVAHNGLTPEKWNEIQGSLQQTDALQQTVSKLRRLYNRDFKGAGLGSILEYLPATMRPANGVFNDTAGRLRAQIAKAQGLTSQQFNTPAEQQQFFEPYIPSNSDTDQQIENKLSGLQQMITRSKTGFSRQMGIKTAAPARQGKVIDFNDLPE